MPSREAKQLAFDAPGEAWTPVAGTRSRRRPATPFPKVQAADSPAPRAKSPSRSPSRSPSNAKSADAWSSMVTKLSTKSAATAESGSLYPTVAVSDAFNAAAHGYAAHVAHGHGETAAALGFGIVALASFVGTMRFGWSDNFARANGDLAHLAAFLGLPLVGLAFGQHHLAAPLSADQVYIRRAHVLAIYALRGFVHQCGGSV